MIKGRNETAPVTGSVSRRGMCGSHDGKTGSEEGEKESKSLSIGKVRVEPPNCLLAEQEEEKWHEI